MKSVSYPIAKNSDGQWIPIEEASKGERYYCPECKSLFVLRKGDVRVHHFAHKPGYSGVCSGESGYHNRAKYLLQHHFEKSGKFPLCMKCHTCGKEKGYELKVLRAEVEKGDDEGRPDVRIYLESNYIIDCEVVYKNPLGDKFKKYSENRKPLLIWNIDENSYEVPSLWQMYWEDKSKCISYSVEKRWKENLILLASPKVPSSHKCRPYGTVYIYEVECWRCHKNTKVAIISSWFPRWDDEDDDGSGFIGSSMDIGYVEYLSSNKVPRQFINNINLNTGTNLREDYSKAASRNYIMNHCSYCDAKIGDWPIKEQLMELLASNSSAQIQKVTIGFGLTKWEKAAVEPRYPEVCFK